METPTRGKRAADDEFNLLHIKSKVVVRHCCHTKYIAKINRHLTDAQKICIGKTPFAWMMKLERDVEISKELVKEMCCRWVESRGGFSVNSEVVGFTVDDVCLGLGVRTRGRMFDVTSKPVDSLTRSLFGSNAVNIKMVYEKLTKSENDGSVVEFCRLYILLGMAEFLLPNTNGTVCSGLFSVVDNLDDMWEYNWAEVVRGYLVKSICRVSTSIKNEQCSSIHLIGCSFLLQLWVVYHLWHPTTTSVRRRGRFPRILNLQSPTVFMGDYELNKFFNSDEVIEHFTVSDDELGHAVVYEMCRAQKQKLIDWGLEKIAHLEAKLAAAVELEEQNRGCYETNGV